MLIWKGKTRRFASLAFASLLLAQPAAFAGGFFSAHRSNCGCEGAQTTYCPKCDECRKPCSWKEKFGCKDAPLAPVVGSIPAMMVNQAAIPAPAAQGESEQLKQLRDMLVQTNQAIRTARQSATQQSARVDDPASIQDLKKELEELKTSLDSLKKVIGELNTNPELLK